jgi:predicted nucleotidyltransferase
MLTENKYIQQIAEVLKEMNPYMVLLFGSFAGGSPHSDSDIDLLVVTNDNYIPKDYEEYTQLYLKVSRAIRPVKRRIAIDLIVHTLPMYNLFVKQNSSFCNEVVSKGMVIYESNHPSVA